MTVNTKTSIPRTPLINNPSPPMESHHSVRRRGTARASEVSRRDVKLMGMEQRAVTPAVPPTGRIRTGLDLRGSLGSGALGLGIGQSSGRQRKGIDR